MSSPGRPLEECLSKENFSALESGISNLKETDRKYKAFRRSGGSGDQQV